MDSGQLAGGAGSDPLDLLACAAVQQGLHGLLGQVCAFGDGFPAEPGGAHQLLDVLAGFSGVSEGQVPPVPGRGGVVGLEFGVGGPAGQALAPVLRVPALGAVLVLDPPVCARAGRGGVEQ
jgi:hypothetical protein